MKKLLIGLLLVLQFNLVYAADFPTLPYTFVARQLISASKVMANYNALRNGIIDGTKKLNVAELWINGIKRINSSGVLVEDNVYKIPGEYATLALAVAAIGSATANIEIDSVTVETTGTTVPANVIQISFGALGQIGSTVTVTFNSQFIKAPQDQQIFGDSITVTGSISNKVITPYWWGAVGDGTVDETDALQRMADCSIINKKTIKMVGDFKSKRVIFDDKAIVIDGYGATIQQFSNTTTDDYRVFVFDGKYGNEYSVTTYNNEIASERDVYTTKLTLSGAPTDIAVGDIVKIYSEDTIPQSRFAVIKQGEFGVVAKISGSDIYLSSLLMESYTTTIRITKYYNIPVLVKGLTCKLKAGTDVTSWTEGLGGLAMLFFQGLINPKIQDISVENGVGNVIVFKGCYSYVADNVKVRNLPDLRDNSSQIGYGITDANSEYGRITNSLFINMRHGFTTNTYRRLGESTPVYPDSYGRSRFTKVINSIGIGGVTGAFDTHDEAYGVEFIDDIAYQNSYKPDKNFLTSNFSFGFENRGEKTSYKNCKVYDSDVAFYSFSNSDRQGGNAVGNLVTDVTYDNCSAYGISKRIFYILNSDKVRINGGDFVLENSIDFADSSGYPYPIYAVTINNLIVEDVNIVNKTKDPFTAIFDIKNTNLKVKNSVFETQENLSSTASIVNWNQRFIDIEDGEDSVTYNIQMKNIEFTVGDIPLLAIVDLSDQSDQVVVTAKDVIIYSSGDVVSNNSSITPTKNAGLSSRLTTALFNVPTTNVLRYENINQFANEDDARPNISSSLVEFTAFTPTPLDRYMRNADNIFFNIDANAANRTISSVLQGFYPGQTMVIRNSGASGSIVLQDDTYVNVSSTITVNVEESTTLKWSGEKWVD